MGKGSTELYKRMHRALQEGETVYKQGNYHPINPDKLVGATEIIYRSSWEGAFCVWCDRNDAVLHWGSEPCQIAYKDPSSVDFDKCKKFGIDAKNPMNWKDANYYPDFFIELRSDDGSVRKVIIEIKPKDQTYPPRQPDTNNAKALKKYAKDARRYVQNMAKWEAANRWARERGMEFEVLTEDSLSKMGLLPKK